MNLGGFLQQVALGAGQQILMQPQLDLQQAQAEEAKMQLEQRKADVASQKRFAALMQGQAQGDQAAAQTPMARANVLQQQAREATAMGAFSFADKLNAMAQGELKTAKSVQELQANEKASNLEAVAANAIELQQNPTVEGAQRLVQSAVRAGVDPKSIPQVGTPEFTTWARGKQTAGMSAKDILSAQEKAREFNEREADRKERMRQDAAYRAERLQMMGMLRDSGMGKAERAQLSRGITDTAEAARQLDLLGDFIPGTTVSAFTGLKADDVTRALTAAGANAVSTQQQQLMQATAANAGKAALNAYQQLGGGRAATEQQSKEYQRAITPQAGDTALTAIYKNINAREELFTALEGRTHPDPAMQAKLAKTLDTLHGPLTAKELLKFARQNDPRSYNQMIKSAETLNQATKFIYDVTGTPPAEVKPAPAGAVPADVQDLVNKYKTK